MIGLIKLLQLLSVISFTWVFTFYATNYFL